MKRSISQETNAAASARNIPLSGFVEVTRACNFRCYYCYQGAHARGQELTVEEWQRVLGEIAQMGGLYLAFSGGEPFCRGNFLDIIAAARGHGFAVSVITNASLLNTETVGRMAQLGVMDVGVSFHGADAALHDRLAGMPGSFDQALRALRLLKATGIKTLVKHCVSSENFGEYRALGDLADREGAVLECDSTVLPSVAGSVSDYALSVEQHRTFLADMEMDRPLSCGDDSSTWSLHCDAGRSMYGITPEGDVRPCILLPIRFGNVRDAAFPEIWNGPQAGRFRVEEKQLELVCETCSIKGACSRCHAVAQMETGNWRAQSPGLCDRAHAFARDGE